MDINIRDMLDNSSKLANNISDIEDKLKDSSIDESERAKLEDSLSGAKESITGYSDSLAEQLESALLDVYDGDTEKVRDVMDYARGEADNPDSGKSLFEALEERLEDDGAASSVASEDTSGNPDVETGANADHQESTSDAGPSSDSKAGQADDIEIDEKTYAALSNIYDSDEDKIKEAYQYLESHYDGDLGKIQDTVNFASRYDIPDGVSKEEALGNKVAYDDAKVEYDDTKSKYLFRNTFTIVDKLQLNIEAYKTGLPGSTGKKVSGGDIAMNIIELTKTNILESLIEIGIRAYFDYKYPPKDSAVDKGMETKNADGAVKDGEQKAATSDNDKVTKDSSGSIRDDGFADKGFDKAALHIGKDSPGLGVYMGTDMSRGPMTRDGMNAWYTDRATSETYVVNGEANTVRIPPMQLVEVQGNQYLVDPVGKATPVNIGNEGAALKLDINGEGYLKSFDISATKNGGAAIEAIASNKGISVADYKESLSEAAKTNYIEKTADTIEKHGTYLEKSVIPDTKDTIDAYKEKLEALSGKADSIRTEISDIEKRYDPNDHKQEDVQRVEKLKGELSDIEGKSGKISAAIEKAEDRLSKMEKTIERYGETKTAVSSDKVDTNTKLASVVTSEKDAAGRAGNVDYGITSEDSKAISETLEKIYAEEDVEKHGDKVETAAPDDSKSDDSKVDGPRPSDVDSEAKSTSEEDTAKDSGGKPIDVIKAAGTTDSDKVESATGDSAAKDQKKQADGIGKDSSDVVTGSKTIDKAPGDVGTREKALGAELESYKDKAQDIVLGAQNDASEITEQIVSLRGQIIPMQEAIDDLNGKKDPVSIEQRSELKDAVKELRADIDSLGKDYKIMVDKADIADSFLTQIADNPRMSLEERVEAAHGSAEAMGITKEEMGQFRVDAETLEGKAESKVENDAEKALDTFDPAKTVEAEDLSKTVDRQDPSKATEHQDPSKAVEQQDLSKAVEQADPSKAVEQEDSSKAADKEDPLKTVEREDPSKSVEQEDPSKAVEAEDPSKIVESEFAQEIQVDNPEDAVGDGAVSDGEDTIDVDETTPDESVADTEHDNSPSSDKGDDAAALEDSVSPDNEGDTYIDNDGGDKPDSGSDDTDNSSKDSTDSEDNGSERDGTSNDTKEESSETADTGNSKNDEPDDDDFESAVDTESGGGNRSVSSTGSREDDDDASIVAGAEQGASKSDIFDALDKYLEQGEDGTFSFKEDFLDEKGDKISKEDLQEAFSEKIGEIEDEIKSGDVDDDKIDKMSDVIGDIFDFQIEHYMSRIEDLGNFIDAILDRDFSSAGNMIIENFLDKVSADLEPLSKMADFINEHVDPDGAMAGESLKESIVEQLDNIGLDFSDANIDKIVDIADTLNNIFDGFENLLTGMAETYSADVDLGVDVMDAMPEMDSVDAHELAESLQAQAEITEAAIDGDVMANSVQPPDFPDDSFDSDFDISDYSLQDNVDSLHDVLNGIDNSMDAAIEAATEEMSVEEIVAMLL